MEKERFRWQTVFQVSILESGDRANDFLNLQGPVFCFEYLFEELLVVFYDYVGDRGTGGYDVF